MTAHAQYSLFDFDEVAAQAAPHTAAQPDQQPARLWLCLWLPDLPADALPEKTDTPLIVSDQFNGRMQVFASNRAARRYGIRNGMPLAAALPLCADLSARPREPAAEQALMQKLAALAYGFSANVAFYGERSLVLEIKSGLRLFGGLDRLLRCIVEAVDALALHYRYAVAPSPRAAAWLARYRHACIAGEQKTLHPLLRTLPVSVLCDDDKTRTRLSRSGIRTLADVMRLPRQDTGRRFGRNFLRPLDQATCHQSEVLTFYRPAEVFYAAHDFYQPTAQQEWIEVAASTLLQQLQQFLLQRQLAVQRIECRLYHERRLATHIVLGTAQPTTSVVHWRRLLHEHLHATALSAEVAALDIRVFEFVQPAVGDCDLFQRRRENEQGWQELLDRLHTRLGANAMQTLRHNADHRPEYAHRVQGVASHTSASSQRPLWLLQKPQALERRGGELFWQRQRLRTRSLAERIEQGWWADDDIRRDYHIAVTDGHARLWIFRDLRTNRWFVHGFFA